MFFKYVQLYISVQYAEHCVRPEVWTKLGSRSLLRFCLTISKSVWVANCIVFLFFFCKSLSKTFTASSFHIYIIKIPSILMFSLRLISLLQLTYSFTVCLLRKNQSQTLLHLYTSFYLYLGWFWHPPINLRHYKVFLTYKKMNKHDVTLSINLDHHNLVLFECKLIIVPNLK